MEQSISLRDHVKNDEHVALLKSRKALTAFHEKCLELVKEKGSAYLTTEDFIELLGGSTNVTPTFIRDVLNIMVANYFIGYSENAEGKPVYQILIKDKGVDLSSLSREESVIYTRLQQAGNVGVSKEHLQKSSNIALHTFNKAVTSLETKKYIKRVRSVKHKTKIILMLYNLEPTDDVTGGPWYTDNKELDSVFVEDLLQVVVRVVDKRSFPSAKKVPRPDGTEILVNRFFQPTYRGYATAQDIYEFIIAHNILQDDVKETFGISQVHQLLEVACITKQIQKRTDGVTYRSLLSDEEVVEADELDVLFTYEGLAEDVNNIMLQKGYTEAPCGRCPVFVECGDPGEEVSAGTCRYWHEWTGQIKLDDYSF